MYNHKTILTTEFTNGITSDTIGYYTLKHLLSRWNNEDWYQDLGNCLLHLEDGMTYHWIVNGQKITKRLYHAYYEYTKKNLPATFRSEFGGLVGKLITDKSYKFVISNCVDWSCGTFKDSGSCYWSGRSAARPAIQDAGGGSIRIYSGDEGIGRCWILPRKDYCIIWNSYGDISLGAIAKILADKFECEFKSVDLSNDGYGDTVWINDDSGYVIGEYSKSYCDLEIPVDSYTCYECGCSLSEDDCYRADNDDNDYCKVCFCNIFTSCERCGESVRHDDAIRAGDNYYCCESCANRDGWYQCSECGNYEDSDEITAIDGDSYCDQCVSDHFLVCDECGDCVRLSESIDIDGKSYCCDTCADKHKGNGIDTCIRCFTETDLLIDGYCVECHSKDVQAAQGITQLDFISNDRIIEPVTGEVLWM